MNPGSYAAAILQCSAASLRTPPASNWSQHNITLQRKEKEEEEEEEA